MNVETKISKWVESSNNIFKMEIFDSASNTYLVLLIFLQQKTFFVDPCADHNKIEVSANSLDGSLVIQMRIRRNH